MDKLIANGGTNEGMGKMLPNPTPPLSKSQQARLMFEQNDWTKLLYFKQKSKKSWSTFGFNYKEIGQITKAMS